MPFKSLAQRRACYAKHDPNWDCAKWERHTKNKRLPERMGFKEWLNDVLYHHSRPSNRASILKNGLQTKYDQTGDENSIKGIYLSDKATQGTNSDVWEVNVSGLNVEEDYSASQDVDEYGNWYVIYQNISPNRIKLIANQS